MRVHNTYPSVVRAGCAAVLLACAAGTAVAADDPLGDLIKARAAGSAPATAPAASDPPAATQGSGASVWGQALAPLDGLAPSGAATEADGTALKPLETGSLLPAAAGLAGALGAGGLADAGLQGLSLPSLAGAPAANVAGVLEYCVRNNYLNRLSVDNVRDGLLERAGLKPTEPPERNAGYSTGLGGLLAGGDGQSLNFTMIQANLKEKACDYVLQNASSLL